MGGFAKLLGLTPRYPWRGLRIGGPCWEVEYPEDFPTLFRALEGWLPEDATLYFEDGRQDDEIDAFMARAAVTGPRIPHGSFGSPRIFHVPTKGNLEPLAELMEGHDDMELAGHFHVYRTDVILLMWYDVFDHPISLGDAFSEDQVRVFAAALGTTFKRAAG